jgi:hypothetical protein
MDAARKRGIEFEPMLVRAGARIVEDHMAPAQDRIALLLPMTVGAATTAFTIVVHALALITIVHLVRREQRLGHAGVQFWRDVTIVGAGALLALAAHLVEIAAWAWILSLCGPFPDFGAAFFHSAGNYTTLGDQNVVMPASWKLLGPLEAADGMLMFGVSTGMIFAIIQRLVQTRFSSDPS